MTSVELFVIKAGAMYYRKQPSKVDEVLAWRSLSHSVNATPTRPNNTPHTTMSVRVPSAMDTSQLRPRRPPSTRPATAASNRTGDYIVAIYENRGPGECTTRRGRDHHSRTLS